MIRRRTDTAVVFLVQMLKTAAGLLFIFHQLGSSLLGQSIENSDFEVNAKGFLAEYYQLDKSDSNNSEGKTLKNKKYKKKV